MQSISRTLQTLILDYFVKHGASKTARHFELSRKVVSRLAKNAGVVHVKIKDNWLRNVPSAVKEYHKQWSLVKWSGFEFRFSPEDNHPMVHYKQKS